MSDRDLRGDLGFLIKLYGLPAVQRALAHFEDPERPASAAAIRAFLLADLAEWPAVFRRRVAPYIEHYTEDLRGACDLLERFERDREFGIPSPGDSICRCGCNGLNEQLARYLDAIREAASMRQRGRRADFLDGAKETLLAWLWRTGQRRVDRWTLRQHAVEAAKLEIERLEKHLEWRTERVAELEDRLERGVYQRRPRKGQPYTDAARRTLERGLTAERNVLRESRERLAHLRPLVTWDVPQLVREFTGCARETRA